MRHTVLYGTSKEKRHLDISRSSGGDILRSGRPVATHLPAAMVVICLIRLCYTINMKKLVYLETTIFSFYYDDRPNSIYRQNITIEWWNSQREYYDLCTSYFTLEEIKNPVYPNWEKVSELTSDISILKTTAEIKGIVRIYMANQLMPSDDVGDTPHLSIASDHSVDSLLTFNFRHLANTKKKHQINLINLRLGLMTPEIITPEQLFREENYV